MKTVPVGVEKVLYTAALDEEFKKELFQNCETAIRTRGFKLRDSELNMLRMIPAPQLEAAIDNIDTSSDNLERRTFMRAVAASAATIAAAEVLSACGDDNGIRGLQADAGVRPVEGGDDAPSDAGPDDAKDGNTVDISEMGTGLEASVANGIRPKG